jgi:hypothetical protein
LLSSDDLLQADVAADIVPNDVEQPKSDEPRHPAVPVAERMDHREVEDVRGAKKQRLVDGVGKEIPAAGSVM